jgi:hypothetical protein
MMFDPLLKKQGNFLGSRSIRRAQTHAFVWLIVIIVIGGGFSAAYVYTGGFKFSAVPGPYNPGVSTTSAGSGACVTDGLVHVVTSPGPCYNVQQFVQVHLFDNYAGSSLSGWSCTFYTLSGGAWTFAESVTNTAANGNCVTTGSYSPGTPMYVWACHSSSACASTSYTQQITDYFAPLPPPNGLTIGAGTVSLANVPATSTPTETTNLPLVLLAGDKAASNTPFNCVLKAPNGTAIINSACASAASATCYLNEASGTHPCYLGTGTTNVKLSFSLQYQVSFSTTTYPYGLGFASFTPVNNPSRGTLSSGITMEEKQASGTDFSIPTMLGTTFTKNGQFLSSTDALYYATPSDSSITKTVASDGTVTNTGQTSQTITIDASSQAGATSADQTTFTFKFYAYFSVSFYTANGAINSEAVTQAATVTLTLQTH